MAEKARDWVGKAVSVKPPGLGELLSHKPYTVRLTEAGARNLALSIAKLKQTTMMVPVEVEELLDALNYVLVGDPHSRAQHQRMEAGKGMEPSGG